MKQALQIFRQPYPIAEVTARHWLFCVVSGFFVAFFLLFFQPFGIFSWQTDYKVFKLLGYGLVTTAVMAFNFFGLQKQLKVLFKEEDWTVGKHIIWSMYMLMSISLANFAYNLCIGTGDFEIGSLLTIMVNTFAVGIFPSLAFTVGNYLVQLKKYPPIPIDAPVQNYSHQFIKLLADNGKDFLETEVDKLLFMESSDNYTTVYFVEAEKVKKYLLRSSLSRLEKQVTGFPHLQRCHRSYLVNLGKVQSVSGNAQGYKLELFGFDTPVPLARKYVDLVKHISKKSA